MKSAFSPALAVSLQKPGQPAGKQHMMADKGSSVSEGGGGGGDEGASVEGESCVSIAVDRNKALVSEDITGSYNDATVDRDEVKKGEMFL